MTASVPARLKGSAEREAVDSLRGYSYQILRSIEAWIDLSEGAILVLEGAEDLDIIEKTGAATVEQVKDTSGSGNVTLRSESVLEAISNFWDHLERNPGAVIQFRFLTTSGIGREKKQPFGFDIPGLEAWQRIQLAPSDNKSLEMAAGIKAFLKDDDTLSEPYRLWLGSASTEDFITRIVLSMEWVAGWPTSTDLYDTIVAKLVELGEKRGLSSADAVKALDALHTEAWRIATTKGSRVLRRGDLLRMAAPTSQDAEEFVRALFRNRLESQRELVVIGSMKPLALREYVGRVEDGRFILDITAEGAGSYQPIFHIDMLMSLAGKNATGVQRILVGDPGKAEDILGTRMPYSLSSVYDNIASELAGRGFEVVRNPLVHWPTDTGTRAFGDLKAIAQQQGSESLQPAVRELEKAGARSNTDVSIVSWHHITWNNCLVEIGANVGRNVYLPTFGHGLYASLGAIDDYMRHLWMDLGFAPVMLGDFNSFAERMGVVHCIKKYLRRGD